MKKFNYLSRGSCILLASSLFLFSCKKQITEPSSNEAANVEVVAQAIPPTTCKPAVFGSFGRFANNWVTLHQKWYDSNGKVANLKARFGATGNGFPVAPFFYPLFMDWSVITYEGNQVIVTQHPENHQVIRVTLNDQGLPEALYYHVQRFGDDYKDTSYLYYTGTRLDSMISLVAFSFSPTGPVTHTAAKYIFSYDAHGNLSEVDFPDLSPDPDWDGARLTLGYDLTKPVSGIMVNHNISIPFRLLEAMELIRLPMHYALTDYVFALYKNGPGNTETQDVLVDHHFTEYNISSDGLVQSYVLETSSNRITYYNGWDCSGGMMVRSKGVQKQDAITSLEQFRQLFPQHTR